MEETTQQLQESHEANIQNTAERQRNVEFIQQLGSQLEVRLGQTEGQFSTPWSEQVAQRPQGTTGPNGESNYNGYFNVNNGMFCAVSQEGGVSVGPFTGLTKTMLEERGLRSDETMPVLLSSSIEERKGNSELGRRIEDTFESAKVAEKGLASGLPVSEIIHPTMSSTAEHEKWLNYDTTETSSETEKTKEEIIQARLSEIGKYAVEDGILTVVSGLGTKYMRPMSAEALETVQKTGYVEGEVEVPLANGKEKIVDYQRANDWERSVLLAKAQR